MALLQGLWAAAVAVARKATSDPSYTVYLKLMGDCITMDNPNSGGPSRDRTYEAWDDSGPVGATITERVLDPSGGASPYINDPFSQSSTAGVFKDQVGFSNMQLFFGSGNVQTYQYFVTTLAGTNWVNVPTFVQTGSGDFMVFAIGMSTTWVNGKKVSNVSYNGDGGMWNADGSPRLQLCGK